MFLSKSKKSPFYQITYEVNGKRTTVSTGTKSLSEAKILLASFNVSTATETKPKFKRILLSAFQNEYLEYIQNTKSKNYIRSVDLSFRMLIEFGGDIYLHNLDFKLIDKFITSTFSRTKYGASMYYRSLKAAFSKAVMWNYIKSNPFKAIKTPKPPKSFPAFITEAELQVIIDSTSKGYLKDIFFTAFYTGMRLGEIINMRWSWIDLSRECITVKCSSSFVSKGKKDRVIPLTAKLLSIFTEFHTSKSPKAEDYVFSRPGRILLKESHVSHGFKRAAKAAGLKDDVHFHTLRHSFASLLVQKGVSLYVVKELLGHEDIKTTMVYSHLQPSNLREAINKLEL